MDLSILVLTLLFKLSSSLQCYKCEAQPSPYEPTAQLCEHLDYSERFIINCDSSSMCYKRIMSLDIGNGVSTTSVQRGCALQTMSGDQRRIEGKWQQVHIIYDVYKEGCNEDPSNGERITKTTHCYCTSDLCNSVGRLRVNTVSLLLIIITWLVFS